MNRYHRTLKAFALALLLFAVPAIAPALDAPHNIVECGQCHSVHGATYPNMLGVLCESCHYESGPATAVKTHSSINTSNKYGDWEVDCWSCHNPHVQEQDDTYATSYGMFLNVDRVAEIKEIDPFTFLANFNRGVRDDNRQAMWQFLKNEWKLVAEVPSSAAVGDMT